MTEKQSSDVIDKSEQSRASVSSVSTESSSRTGTGLGRPGRERSSRWVAAAAVGAVVGVLSVGGGLFTQRWLLVALGGAAVYVAGLTYYLAPEEPVSKVVPEQIYRAYADGRSASDRATSHLYVPTASNGDGVPSIRLAAVGYDGSTTRLATELGHDPSSERHRPIGAGLLDSFVADIDEPLAAEPSELSDQMAAGLVDGFGLVDSVDIVRRTDDSVRFRLKGCALGPLTRFDHPTVSFLGSAFAAGLDRPARVVVERRRSDDSYVVDCRVDAETAARDADYSSA
ncbi:hypothetical protein [Haloprofundus salilacus]|uniref:hypothetical protein n=1 Tax=Haloprofundus salilacus TaxID=2876190 RepID=UPI001CCEEF97|nr:hypothetical protein [Haloprofundus salilacus]